MSRPIPEREPHDASRTVRKRKQLRVVAAAATGIAGLVATTDPATAATTPGALPKALAVFAHCPISDPAVTACLYASTGGTFQVGNASLTLPRPATLSLGLIPSSDGTLATVLPTDGTPGLSSPTVTVPVLGGLVGVGATPTLAGPPTGSLAALLTGSNATAISLPLVVVLSNPLLGPSCTLGTTSAPLVVDLTAGTTNPPPPNTPISGSKGTLTSKRNGLVTVSGASLVDNAFAAPGASGCGLLGSEDLLVDTLEGLPSPAGRNSAVLSGTIETVPASLIRRYLG